MRSYLPVTALLILRLAAQSPIAGKPEPSQPKPFEAVQKLFDEANKLQGAGNSEGALEAADRALALARDTHDAVGEVCAHRGRAIFLELLNRIDEATAEWRETAAGWERVGDGPGRIEALGRSAQLLFRSKPREAEELLEQAISLSQQERARPLAAADQMDIAGTLIYKQRNLEWAKKLFQSAFEIRNRWAPGSLAVAASLGNLGLVAGEQGELKADAEYLHRALAIQEKLAPDSLAVAASLNNLGVVAAWQQNLKAAAEYYCRALTIREKLAPDSLSVAETLSNLGAEAGQQWDLKTSEEYYRRALAIQEKLLPDSMDVALSLNGLGALFHAQGDLNSAAEYHRRALDISARLAPDSLSEAGFLHNLGEAIYDQGDLKGSAEYFRRALAIREKLAPDSLDMASSLTGLGGVAEQQGDLKTAAECYRHALAIQEKVAPESLAMAASLNNLGMVASAQGDLKAASEYFQRALAVREKVAPESLVVAASLNNLGTVAHEYGDIKAAAEYHLRALAIKERWAPGSLDVAASLNNLAALQGDPKVATEYYRRALVIFEKLAPDSLDVAGSLHNLGMVAAERGDPKAAAEYYRRSLAIREKLAPDSLNVAASLNDLAISARDSGKEELESAETLAKRAWRIVQHQAEFVTGDETRQAFGSANQGYAGVLLGIQVARGKADAAFVTLEEGRAQAIARLLFERREVLAGATGDLWPRHQAALANLHHAEEELGKAERLPGHSPEADQRRDDARKLYQQARQQVDRVWAEIQKREPRAFVPTVDLASAKKTLDPKAVFVAFSVDGDRQYAFEVSGAERAGVLVKKLGPGERDLGRRVLDFWQGLRTPPPSSSEPELAAEGHELFDLLFPGEIGELVRKSKRLIISPDGSLWQLPFAALVTQVDPDGTPHYLGEEVAISYTPSLSLYVQLKKERPQLAKGERPEVLVVGNPAFERKVEPDPKNPEARRVWAGLYPEGSKPRPLAATAKEASVIARLYGRDPLTGENATEAEVRKRIEKADVIHLATHGALQTVLPMSSGLVLTPPRREPDLGDTNNDGALQAWEIFSQLKLRAELVVLSACETARGQIVRGEGILGLTRALEYAGARSVVATQWSVASGESTSGLMEKFHENLRRGKAKDEALKEAMEDTRKRYPHPFYWAAFIVLGDPDNPNLARNWSRQAIEPYFRK